MNRIFSKKAEYEIKLNTFLKKEMGLTEKQISQAKFRENGIRVNGERTRITTDLRIGDYVEVLVEENESQNMVPAEGQLEILYEDEDLLVINKPAGIVVHPSHGHYADSILNLAAGYYEKQGKNVNLRVVGRLDKDTSGVLVLAKNQIAAARLSEQKEQGIFEKEYLAVPVKMPVPEEGTIRKPMQKDPCHLNKMRTPDQMASVFAEDKAEAPWLNAVTHYKPQNTDMLCVRIETGRTHQIRVHLASIGCPLVGDTLYGTADDRIGRTALHAWKVQLIHPVRAEKLEFTAQIPSDFIELFRNNKNTFDKMLHSV